MEKILYVHGLGSVGNGRVSKLLQDNLPNYEIEAPEIPIKPNEAMEFIMNLLDNNNYKMVVGSSLGAYYVMYCKHLPKKFLINPAVGGGEYIEKYVGRGEHEFYGERNNGETSYIIDDDFITNLNDMKYELDDEDDLVTRCVVSETDELFGEQNVERCMKTFNPEGVTVINSSHSVEDEIIVNEIIPKIKEFIDTDLTKSPAFIGPYIDFDDEDWID